MAKSSKNASKPHDYSKMVDGKNNGRTLGLISRLNLDVARNNNIDLNMNYLVLLNADNSKKVETAITNDPKYPNYIEMVYEHFKNIHQGTFPRYDEKAITALVKIIDYENSTDVNIHNKNAFKNIIDFIIQRPQPEDSENCFWKKLFGNDISLVDDLIACAITGKKPYSLASKICKYFAKCVLGGKHGEYYINDSFVRHVIPHYYYYYVGTEIKNPDIKNYKQLCDYLKDIHNEVNKIAKQNGQSPLNKDQLDHIMWYSYKNSL